MPYSIFGSQDINMAFLTEEIVENIAEIGPATARALNTPGVQWVETFITEYSPHAFKTHAQIENEVKQHLYHP
jgi:hypothetical protein